MVKPSRVPVWNLFSVSMVLSGSSMSLAPLGGVGSSNEWCAQLNAASRRPLEMHEWLMKSFKQYWWKSKEYLTFDPWPTSMKNSKNQSHLPRYALGEGCSVPFQRPKVLLEIPQPQSCLEGRSILIWFSKTSGTVGEGSIFLNVASIILARRQHNLEWLRKETLFAFMKTMCLDKGGNLVQFKSWSMGEITSFAQPLFG